ncbi:Uncharacterized protein HZ326_11211 [Fusarium oxysporum f. sp. albedinis]|nr:Uncharacterized protein HZ326_11211 [Fusarium oxysporum f. sp. albedinis]
MLMYANPRYVNLLRVTMLTAPQDDIPNKNLKVFKGYPDLICCMCFFEANQVWLVIGERRPASALPAWQISNGCIWCQ